MFRKAIPKSQEPEKTQYTVYYPHSIPITERVWKEPYLRFLSIDPGTVNFAIRVETRPKIVAGVKPEKITAQLYDRLKVSDISGDQCICEKYDNLTRYLDQHLELFRTCHVVIMERQMPFNYKMVRMSQHILTYILIKLKDAPTIPLILEIDAKIKSQYLDAPSNLNDKGVKTWSKDKAYELLTRRGDNESLSKLTKGKTDDYADTVCQIEAICVVFNWPTTSDYIAASSSAASSSSVPSSATGNSANMPRINGFMNNDASKNAPNVFPSILLSNTSTSTPTTLLTNTSSTNTHTPSTITSFTHTPSTITLPPIMSPSNNKTGDKFPKLEILSSAPKVSSRFQIVTPSKLPTLVVVDKK